MRKIRKRREKTTLNTVLAYVRLSSRPQLFPLSQKFVACLIFRNLKKLEPIIVIFGSTIQEVLASKCMHNFSAHLMDLALQQQIMHAVFLPRRVKPLPLSEVYFSNL